MKSIWFICMIICLQTSVFHILAKQRLSSKQHFFFKYEGKIIISYATSLQMKCIHGQQKRHSRNIFLEHSNMSKKCIQIQIKIQKNTEFEIMYVQSENNEKHEHDSQYLLFAFS